MANNNVRLNCCSKNLNKTQTCGVKHMHKGSELSFPDLLIIYCFKCWNFETPVLGV